MTFEIFFVGFFGILCAMMGGLFGVIFVAPFEHKGKGALVRQTLIAAVVAASLILIPSLIFGFSIFTRQVVASGGRISWRFLVRNNSRRIDYRDDRAGSSSQVSCHGAARRAVCDQQLHHARCR